MKRHVHTHLRAKLGRDFSAVQLKRRKVHLLFSASGAFNTGTRQPETVCGTSSAKSIVGDRDIERVTCPHCRRMISRLPKPPDNPRSRMRMPRPT